MSVYSNRFLTGFATLSKMSDNISLKMSFLPIGWHVIPVIYLVPFMTTLICLTSVTDCGPSGGQSGSGIFPPFSDFCGSVPPNGLD
jgi:hypothetical protein